VGLRRSLSGIAGSNPAQGEGGWTSVSCECCVLGRGFCDRLITRPEESHRVCVS